MAQPSSSRSCEALLLLSRSWGFPELLLRGGRGEGSAPACPRDPARQSFLSPTAPWGRGALTHSFLEQGWGD